MKSVRFALSSVLRIPFGLLSHVLFVGTIVLLLVKVVDIVALTFGITGDYDSAPDVGVLARGIENGVAELLRCGAELSYAAL